MEGARPGWVPNWFEQTARAHFERWLLPYRHREMRALQLGVFAGDASEWLLTNLPLCRLTDVDTWKGSTEHVEFDMDEIRCVYEERMIPFLDRVRWVRLPTRLFLANTEPNLYDFVYVDADHHPVEVLRDGLDGFDKLRVGGLLAFDDYYWEPPGGGRGPAYGIDAFRYVMQDRVKPLTDHTAAQVWLRKIA